MNLLVWLTAKTGADNTQTIQCRWNRLAAAARGRIDPVCWAEQCADHPKQRRPQKTHT